MVAFVLNGQDFQIEAADDTPLIDIIRDRAGLTGSKLVCGAGVCGACTVTVDGAPVVSCLTPLANVEGRRVETIEAVGADRLHPIQKAFMAEDALQCGFCTPGFVVAASSFHDAWRATHGTARPSDSMIGAALSGHLCRCAAYGAIYRAVAAACTGAFDGEAVTAARVDARDKVTGAARYTVDVQQPGQLVGLVLRSAHPHAEISGLRVDRALRVAGVKAAVALLGSDNTVRYVGQEIAAVAAIDLVAARAGLAAIELHYVSKPAAVSLDVARRPDAPQLYTGWFKSAPNASEGAVMPMTWNGNRRGPTNALSLNRGVARRTLAQASTTKNPLLVEATYFAAGQSHTCLEPHAAVASFGDGTLVVHASTQASQHLAARIKDIAAGADVQVISDHVGGGFGSKVSMGVETRAAVALAKAAGAPVRVVLDRAEELSVAGHRPEAEIRVKLLADAAGQLKALSVDTDSNAGVAVNNTVSGLARLMYRAEAKELVDWDIVTNLPPGSPFRAPGGPTLCFALEQAIDEAAARLQRDPIALRALWDDDPNRQRLYQWAQALDVWTSRGEAGRDSGRFRRGVGVAAGNWLYFSQSGSEVALRIERGRLIASTAAQDMGQGARTLLAETVARAFDLPVEQVTVEIGRSDLPPGPMAAGSRSTATIVPAALAASEKLKGRLRAATHGKIGANAPWSEMIAQAPDMRLSAERPPDSTTINAQLKNPLKEAGMVGTMFDWLLRRFAHVTTGRGLAGAVQVAEVEVDTWLGKTRVTRFWSGLTIGRPHVPRLALSQAEGSIIQGIGYALYEAREYDPVHGHVLSAGLEDYRIPGIADTPEMFVHFDEAGFEHVPGGGIGIGEIATVPVAAAVANAMAHATGTRFRSSPMRPDRVLAALAAKRSS